MRTIINVVAVATSGLSVTDTALASPFKGPHFGLEVAYEDYRSASIRDQAVTLVGGWDFELAPRWIVGLGGRGTVVGTKASETSRTPAGLIQTSDFELRNQFGISGRVGRIVGKRVLLFAEGGFERFDVDATRTLRSEVCAPPSGCVISNTDFSFKNESMWTMGAGAELAVMDRLRLRASYTYGKSDAFKRERAAIGVVFRF
jgi:opacity protein-like surface antigen